MTEESRPDAGAEMYALAERLWPLPRSLTGDGVRASLRVIGEWIEGLKIHEVSSGTRALDWVVPLEWNVREAWIEAEDGERVVDFAINNLHLVGYSPPTDELLTLDELQPHLYSLTELPDAIPYVTSYYSPHWGFCLSHRDRQRLRAVRYHVHIDSTLVEGSLTYGEIVIKGDTPEEVLLSTNICHPSMANNELSGPCVATALARWLRTLTSRRYTYRIVFLPETIGSIVYLSRHLEHMQRRVRAGFVLTCMGDDRTFSYVPSREGDTLADAVATHVLGHLAPGFRRYSYLDRGSDERQYCAPGVNLPVCSVMRTKYGEYPEYHTSLDDLGLITPEGMQGSYDVLRRVIEVLEADCVPTVTVLGEPQLGRRGLYPSVSTLSTFDVVRTLSDLIAYCDGRHSLLQIAEILGVPAWTLVPLLEKLTVHGLLKMAE